MALPRRSLSHNHPPPTPPLPTKAEAAEPPSTVNTESDFVLILAALLCALVCVVGLILVARCAWLRRSRSGESGGGVSGHRPPPPPSNKGLKKKVLRSLPKYTYGPNFVSKHYVGKQFAADCPICLAEYEEGDEIRVLPQCRHGFHVQCIDTWLGSHSSCPSCRQILVVARCRKCGCKEIPSISAAGAGEESQSSSNSNILP